MERREFSAARGTRAFSHRLQRWHKLQRIEEDDIRRTPQRRWNGPARLAGQHNLEIPVFRGLNHAENCGLFPLPGLDRRQLLKHVINIFRRGPKRNFSTRSPESNYRFHFAEMPCQTRAKRNCTLKFFRSFCRIRFSSRRHHVRRDEWIERNQHAPLVLARKLFYFHDPDFADAFQSTNRAPSVETNRESRKDRGRVRADNFPVRRSAAAEFRKNSSVGSMLGYTLISARAGSLRVFSRNPKGNRERNAKVSCR